MKTLERILCPTDFGACAHGALMQALGLANSHHARIDLLHVANVPRYVRRDMVGFMGSAGAKPLSDIAIEEADKQMSSILAGISEADRQRMTVHTRFGAPVATIMHYAKAHHADIIVMGAAGKARISKYILGGVAGKTVRHAECPVLCVPGEQARQFKKVLVATDFSACSESALDAAAFLAGAAGATLVVAHVTASAWSLPPELSVGAPGQTSNWLELLQREAREQLDDFVSRASSVGTRIDDKVLLIGSPAQSLLHHAAEGSYDLIVLGTHGRSAVARLMLGSVAETVVHHAAVPVLTVREGTPKEESSQPSQEDS